jgi:hypothetical protein
MSGGIGALNSGKRLNSGGIRFGTMQLVAVFFKNDRETFTEEVPPRRIHVWEIDMHRRAVHSIKGPGDGTWWMPWTCLEVTQLSHPCIILGDAEKDEEWR